MRTTHGIDFPDPVLEDNGDVSVAAPEQGWDDPELRSAMDRCAEQLGWEQIEPTHEELQVSLREAADYAECLGRYGIELPDPAIIDGSVYFGDERQDELRGLETADPEIAAALTACHP